MIILDGDVLVLDRTQDGDDILPMNHPAKGGRGGAWYIDLGIEEEAVKHFLIDLEILDEDFPIRYLARNGQQFEGQAHIEELISGPEGDLCRLRGIGVVPPVLLADEPRTI